MANSLIGFVLFLCYKSHFVTGAANSIYVAIRNTSVSDNGYIPFDLIGMSKNSEAVLCHTNDPTCCNKDQANPGNWYYPDGSLVEGLTSIEKQGGSLHNFARNRGSKEPIVCLYRIKNNFAPERGRFRCDIHDATESCYQLYVNILDTTVDDSKDSSSEDYQTTMIIADNNYQTTITMVELKEEQNRILMFGIISVGLAAIIFASAVVILVTLLLRKEFKVCVQSYTINCQYHLYDKIFRRPLTTTRRVEEDTVPKVLVYDNIQLQDASKWSQYEKIAISRCPAYDFDSVTTE